MAIAIDPVARGQAKNAIKIKAAHKFIDNAARDAYFTANPTELKDGIYVTAGGVLYEYTNNIWDIRIGGGINSNTALKNEENIFSEKQIFNQGVLSTKYEFVNNTIEVNESTTLSFEHISKLLKCVNTSNITITIPNDTSLKFPNETLIEILKYGDGEVSIVSSAGVIINSVNNFKNIADKYSAISLKKMGDDEWLLIGNLKE